MVFAEGIIGVVLYVDDRPNDEGYVGRSNLVTTWCLSTGRPGICGGRLDWLLHRGIDSQIESIYRFSFLTMLCFELASQVEIRRMEELDTHLLTVQLLVEV